MKSKPKVLLILREQSNDPAFGLHREVAVMAAMLEKAGIDVISASASGRPIGTGTAVFAPDLKLEEVRVADYDGVLLPSMAVSLVTPIPARLLEIVRRAAARKIPLAAQHGAVIVLQRAGILKKIRYAFPQQAFDEGKYAGPGVVRDGNVITSGTCPVVARETGNPDGTRFLTELFIQTLRPGHVRRGFDTEG
jgi:putative intracellular protease/amidase